MIACDLDISTRRLISYPDLGDNSQQPSDPKSTPLATDALVFMVVGLAAPRRMPFGYLLNARLSGEVLRNLVMQAMKKLRVCGLIIMAVIYDCLGANVLMAKLLGCRVHEQCYDDLTTTLQCPGHNHDINAIFDACHGLKLLRIILGDKGTLISSTYGVIQWKHIEALHQLQEEESLNAANKLSQAHVEYHRQIMKVKLAAQPFSASVIQWKHIEALHQLQEEESLNAANKLSQAHVEYHRQIMKVKLAAQPFSASVSKALEVASQLSLPVFEGCLGTAKFIGMVDKAFELLNCSSPIAKGFEAPLRTSAFHYQKEAMEQVGRELMALQLATGNPLVQERRRMSVISPVFTLKSVSHLAQAIFEADLCW
ncbi:hypothetical protein MRX96_001093 [Rhipicephalus microplus]